MPRKKEYEVKLSEAERNHLQNLISSGTAKARKLTRAGFCSKPMKSGLMKKSVKRWMLG